ncbi:hypothetical protein K440DRAFT_658637 [Wilcoxina mikolae CBS 423.85]|nr:hypothetical protein K440DRAFT_658637 [Wilcoxina mikolae CBS 423.85]
MPPIHDPLFEAQVQQVFTITQKPLHHIRSDLRFTKNVELTIARAFDGEFLKGTDRDPERRVKFWEKEKEKEKGEATKEGASQAKTQAHTVASLAEKIFSSSPRVATHQSLPPLESSPIAGGRTQMEDDPIMFTSSARQQEQKKKKKRKAEVVEIPSDDYEELVPLPAPTRERRVPVSRRETKKSRKDESLDLENVAVYDLSQPERQTTPPAVIRKDVVVANTPTMLPESFRFSTPDTAANGGGGFVRDDISSSPPKTTAKPISVDDDDFDDSLWNNTLWRNYESPEPAPKPNPKPSPINLISDDGDGDEVPPPAPPAPKAKPKPKPKPAFSAATLALLNQFESDSSDNELSNPDSDNNPRPTKGPKPPPASFASAAPKRGRLSEEEKARRAAEKAEKAALVEARKAAKAAKAAEKQREQEILSVNKLRTSKKDSCPEMLVDISTVLARDAVGKHLIGFLTNLGCDVNPNWRPALGIEGTWKIVKWRRKVKATYDEGLDMFLPLPDEEIRDENHLLVHLTAQEFADLVSPGVVDMDLTTHVKKMKSLLPAVKDIRVIYMIEGLAAYTRKSKTHEDRAFREQVLSAMSSTTTCSSSSRRPKTPTISESTLETSLLTLQLSHNCLLHHTVSPLQSSEWISIFTSDISSIPYKTRRHAAVNTSFLGQVKTGVDAEDTMIKMLQEIYRVTPGVARGVVEEFGDVKSLVRAVRRRGGGVMEDVRMGCTKSGARSNRLVGRAVSERIAGVFTGRDGGALEV